MAGILDAECEEGDPVRWLGLLLNFPRAKLLGREVPATPAWKVLPRLRLQARHAKET